jgi:hypothetical protein
VPHAIVLNSASKAGTTGGAFADTLTANANDSLTVVNFPSGGARILEAWGIDIYSVAELQWIYTRPDSSHDQVHGIRFSIPALTPGGAANVSAHNLLPGYTMIPVFPSDAATLQVTTTAADDVLVSWLTEYDDMPGVSASFANWEQVLAVYKSTIGVRCSAVASATPGAYGAARAINADDDRFHARSWYAILGASVQTQVTTIALLGPDFGGQRIGFPAGALDLRSNAWFLDQSIKYGKPMIPFFSAENKANTFVYVADGEASTSPQIDFLLIEMSARPTG